MPSAPILVTGSAGRVGQAVVKELLARGEFLRNATLVGPEARGSSPIRLPRDAATLESTGVAGLYPIGEGAGYAGGIVSAAVDGLRAARAIIARYAPLEARRT